LIQKPTTDYSITGSILNFTVPPPNNTDVEVRYLSPQTFTFISGSGGGGGSGAGFPFSGSAVITGSLLVTDYISGSFTGSLLGTSSYSNNALSSSYALTSSYSFNSISSSYANTSSNSIYAITASYALFTSGSGGGGSGTGFPFSGSAVITGSLNVSQTITLNNTVISASGCKKYIITR